MRHTVVLLTIGALLVATAACGSEGSGDSFGIGQPTTADAPAASTPTSTRGASEPSTPVGSTATPPPAATPSPTSSTTPGPLPEPVVSLVDVGSFDQPVDVVARAGDATAYVVEQPGRVVAATAQSNEPVLDITDLTDAEGERGLLGLAFHPTDALAYIHFTDLSGDTVVAELAVDPTTGQFDRNSFREVLTVDQPFTNHNGGRIVFGPDGYSTSVSATVGPVAIPRGTRWTWRAAWARSCGSTRPRPMDSRSRFRRTIRSSMSPAPTRRSGRSGCATPGSSRSTARTAICGSPTSARTSSRRSTSRSRPTDETPARAPTSDGAHSKASSASTTTSPPTTQCHRCSCTTTAVDAARSPVAASHEERMPATWQAGTCSATTAAARSGRSTQQRHPTSPGWSRSPNSRHSSPSLRAQTASCTPCRTAARSPSSPQAEFRRKVGWMGRDVLPRIRRSGSQLGDLVAAIRLAVTRKV